MTEIRTRVAPSPTGSPHLGTAWIALFNLCFARRNGGRFILRIEDTDRRRSSAEAEAEIIEALKWLGLDWDEGPDVGGEAGPYRQSERLAHYREAVAKLLADGHAFHCFATEDELTRMRKAQVERGETARYDGRGLKLSADEVARRLKAGEPHVVRMKVPEDGECKIQDGLRGEVSIPWSQVDMQIVQKTDGYPTYHLASVVDDHLMRISHVIRGEEWLNSTPKHLLLYQALGWEPPKFHHLPLLRNPDKSKLSKRANPTGVFHYRRAGFLPQALLNYLGRMGWSMPDEREKFSLQEMIDAFDLERVSLGAPIFDPEKLRWLNGEWLRELDDAALTAALVEWGGEVLDMPKLLPALRPRLKTFGDIEALAGFLLSEKLNLSKADFEALDAPLERQLEILQSSAWRLAELRHDWNQERLFEALKTLAAQLEIKMRNFTAPLFVALTGSGSSFSVALAMELLGPDLCASRLQAAIDALGGLSKAKLKKLDRRLRA